MRGDVGVSLAQSIQILAFQRPAQDAFRLPLQVQDKQQWFNPSQLWGKKDKSIDGDNNMLVLLQYQPHPPPIPLFRQTPPNNPCLVKELHLFGTILEGFNKRGVGLFQWVHSTYFQRFDH